MNLKEAQCLSPPCRIPEHLLCLRKVARFAERFAEQQQYAGLLCRVRVGALLHGIERGLEEFDRVFEREQRVGAFAGTDRVGNGLVEIVVVSGELKVASEFRQKRVEVGPVERLDSSADHAMKLPPLRRPQLV